MSLRIFSARSRVSRVAHQLSAYLRNSVRPMMKKNSVPKNSTSCIKSWMAAGVTTVTIPSMTRELLTSTPRPVKPKPNAACSS